MQRDSPTVPGYDVGQFPPVPLFVLPDLSLLDASTSGFTIDVRDDFGAIPGVTVSSARCEDGGRVSSGSGTAYLYGDGSGNFTGPDGTIQNYGDGTGLVNGIEIEVEPIGPVPELGVFPPAVRPPAHHLVRDAHQFPGRRAVRLRAQRCPLRCRPHTRDRGPGSEHL
ncbi:hypothetical protein [Microbacterium sp. GXF6406]